jgi:hypothetical protein
MLANGAGNPGQQPVITSWLEPGSEQVITEGPVHPQGAEVEFKNSISVFRTTGGRLLTMYSLGRSTNELDSVARLIIALNVAFQSVEHR